MIDSEFDGKLNRSSSSNAQIRIVEQERNRRRKSKIEKKREETTPAADGYARGLANQLPYI
jgi:hypothetical protein